MVELLPKARIHNYEIVEALAEGAMGQVYLAEDLDMGRRPVLLKRIKARSGSNARTLARFRREAVLGGRIRNPHVVVIHGVIDLPDGDCLIVMEHLPGPTLREACRARRFTLDDAAGILGQLCSAVAAVHAGGVVHRDLKPSNVILTPMGGTQDFVKLIDFGLAGPVEAGISDRLTQVGARMGTPRYMAPEAWRGERIDQPADQYALAIMAYEVLTGRYPYQVPSDPQHERLRAAHLSAPPLPLSALWPGDPPPEVDALAPVLSRALQKSPNHRYPSVSAFRRALLDALHPSSRPSSHSTVAETLAPEDSLALPDPTRSAPPPFASVYPTLATPSSAVAVLTVALGAPVLAANDQMPALATPLFELVRRCVRARGGRVIGPMTHQVVACFGLDVHGDLDLKRAVDAGLAIRAGLASQLAPDLSLPTTAFGLGIDWGPLLVARDPDQFWIVTGRPVLRSALLATRCAAGVAVSSAAYRATEARYAWTEAPGDGFFVATGRQTLLGRLSDSARFFDRPIPFVGRARQLSLLAAKLGEIIAGGGARSVSLTGGRGLGKSRLVLEFLRRLEGQRERVSVLAGRCDADPSNPYKPIADALATLMHLRNDQGEAEQHRHLAHFVRRQFILADQPLEDSAAVAAALWRLMGGAGPGSRSGVGLLGSDVDQSSLFEGVARFLQILTHKQPVVLFVDDLHHATVGTQQLLEHLRRSLADQRVFFLAADRAEGTPAGAEEPLPPLEPGERRTLIEGLLAPLADPPSWLIDDLVVQCEGRPEILIEIISDLIRSGRITREDDSWTHTLAAREPLPHTQTAQEVWAWRLDSLLPDQRALIQAAAVIGLRFWASLAAQLAFGGADPWPRAERVLVALKRQRLIASRGESPIAGESDLVFATEALKQVAYDSVPAATRRAWHGQIARWLTGRRPYATGPLDAQIAAHFTAAGEPQSALAPMARAAAFAVAQGGIAESATLLARCRTLLRELPDAALPAGMRAAYQRKIEAPLVRALVLFGRLRDAEALGHEVLARFSGVEDDAAAAVALWTARAMDRMGRNAEAAEMYGRAIELSTAPTLPLVVLARIGRAAAKGRASDWDTARAELDDVLTQIERHGGESASWDRVRTDAFRSLANVHIRQRRFEPAAAWLRQAQQMADALDDPVAQAECLNSRAALAFYRQDHTDAEHLWRAMLALSNRRSLLQHRGIALANLGELYLETDQLDAALDMLQKADQHQRWLDSDLGRAETRCLLALACLASGRLQEAEEHAQQAVDFATRTALPTLVAKSRIARAEVSLALGAAPAAPVTDAVAALSASPTALADLDAARRARFCQGLQGALDGLTDHPEHAAFAAALRGLSTYTTAEA